jgi:hypothetical protein
MRRYREDSERVIRLRNYWVRRPQATPVSDRVNLQDIWEIVGGVVIFGTLFLGIPFLLFLIGAPR